MTKTLLIAVHSQSGGTHALACAAQIAARNIAPEVTTTLLPMEQVSPERLHNADGLIIASPENFGYMAGLVKDMFDRCFYPCEHAMRGKPYALIVCAGNDGTGAMNSMERIITGWRMRNAHENLIVRRVGGEAGSAKGSISEVDLARASTMGATLAAGLDTGIF